MCRDLLAWWLASGNPGDAELVFPGRDGRPWDDGRHRRWRSRTFDRACSDAGLDGVTPYSLRHAFASLLVKSGLNVVEIAAQLGHGPGVTLSTYAHLLDSLGDGRVDAYAEIRRAKKTAVEVREKASSPGTDDFRAAVASEALATGHRRRGHASAAARNRHVPLASTVPRRPETMEF